MSLEELVRETVPDFMDVEVTPYIEETENGDESEIVQVTASHDGQKYGFEMVNRDELPEEVEISQLSSSYSMMIESVIKDEL